MEKIVFKQILSKNPLTYDEENPKDFYFTIPTANFTYSSNVHKIQYNANNFVLGTDLLTIINNNSYNEYQAFTADGQKLGMIIKCLNARDNFLIYEEETKIYFSIYSAFAKSCYLTLNYKYIPNIENYTLNDVLEKARVAYEEKTSVYTVGMWRYDNAIFCPMRLSNKNLYSPGWVDVSDGCYELANGKLRYFSSWYKLITGKFYKEDELFKMSVNDGQNFVFTKITDIGEINSSILNSNIESEEVQAEPSYAVKDLIYGTDLSHFCPNINSTLVLKNGIEVSFEKKDSNLVVNISKTYLGKYNKISFLVTNGVFGNQYLSFVDNGGANFDYERIYARTNAGFNLAISPFYNNVPFENFENFLSEQNFYSKEWVQNLGRVITLVATNNMSAPNEIREKYGYYTGEIDVVRNIFSFIGLANFSESTYVSSGSNSLTDTDISGTMENADDWFGFIDFSDGPQLGPEPEPEPTPVKKRTSKLNIKELSQMAIKNGTPLLGDVEKLEPFAFMSEYLEDFEMFDEDLGETRGFYFPLWNVENGTEEEVLEHFRKRSAFTIKKHKTEIEGFKAIDDARWNPIENYDRYETNSTKRSGKDTVTDMIDGVSVTNEYGQQGSSTTTGEQTGSNTVGEHTSTTTNEHAGFNSSDYQKNGKSTTDSGSQTSNSTVGARTDTASIDAHTDSMTTEAREDVHETAYDNTTEFETHIHGNIGVTTATQMLEEAKDFYSNWNFYNKLFDLILKELAIYYEE